MSELIPRSQETNDKIIKLAKNSQHAGKMIIIGVPDLHIDFDAEEFKRLWKEQVCGSANEVKWPVLGNDVAVDLEWRSLKQNFNLFPADGKNSKLWEKQRK
jgi:hypothetical protein